MAKVLILSILALALLGLASLSAAQNCGCTGNNCCSKYGYCGVGDAYCGDGCREGPCSSKGGTGSVDSVVTDAFFNGIINRAAGGCAGKNFYTRSAFLAAARAYPSFGTTGSAEVQKREIAAFFAHVTHETGSFCYIEEINGTLLNYCQASAEWPCNPSKKYHGRGPIQISWNYNYGPAGRAIGFDGLNFPETVSRDAIISFKTAFWFWMNNVHSIMASGLGFGPTIRAINGAVECDGGNPGAVSARIQYYTQYCQQLGVSTGGNLSC